MERITLYHRGTPITHHPLCKGSFSIGSDPANDLVLAGEGVAERHLLVYRGDQGKWRAELVGEPGSDRCEMLSGTRVSLGAFAVALEQADPDIRPRAQEPPVTLEWAGRSPALQLLLAETRKLAPLSAPVLITGESGTGKELVARGLHQCSKRSAGPFVTVNCGGLTESLLEDTLFGHEKGAFTGAESRTKGVFEQAHRGTVFLDEIGELPLKQQASLLRVLEEKRVHRIGAASATEVDFRLITATNRNLLKRVKQRRFRLDLYHRIAMLTLTATPLRHRPEDVEPLVQYFCRELRGEFGVRRVAKDALIKLSGYSWPGNVRELRNVLYRAFALTDRRTLTADHFNIVSTSTTKPKVKLSRIPADQLRRFLEMHHDNIAAAARALGVPRTTLRDRLVAAAS
jgi:DNA-binding NtrC family response regulator